MKEIFFCILMIFPTMVSAQLTAPTGLQKATFVPAKKECYSVSTPVDWKYCVHTPQDGKTNGNVAYLLHGRNLSEQTWNEESYFTGQIQQYWQTNKLIPPIVVSISFGPVWLLTPKGQSGVSGLLEVFTQTIIPEVEKRTGLPKSRIVFGESMGGVNSTTLAVQSGHLFKRVGMMCPTIYQISPFQPLSEIQKFVNRTGADPKTITGIIQLAKIFFATEDEWKANDHFQLLEKLDPATAPEMYMSCGLYDAYGNYEGTEAFALKAKKKGLKLEWHPQYGGHCVIEVPSIAEFLAR